MILQKHINLVMFCFNVSEPCGNLNFIILKYTVWPFLICVYRICSIYFVSTNWWHIIYSKDTKSKHYICKYSLSIYHSHPHYTAYLDIIMIDHSQMQWSPIIHRCTYKKHKNSTSHHHIYNSVPFLATLITSGEAAISQWQLNCQRPWPT